MLKIIIKILLTIIGIPVFIAVILLMIVKLQLLNPNYWQKIFLANNVYTKVSDVVIKNLNNQVIASGSTKDDAKIIIDLITPENTQDLIDQNIIRVLNYINGKNNNLTLYIPTKRIPDSFLSEKQINDNLSNLINTQSLKNIGKIVNYLLTLSGFCLIVVFGLLFAFSSSNKRLISFSIYLVCTSVVLTIIGVLLRICINNYFSVLRTSDNLIRTIMETILPVITSVLIDNLFAISVIIGTLGVLFVFVKKTKC